MDRGKSLVRRGALSVALAAAGIAAVSELHATKAGAAVVCDVPHLGISFGSTGLDASHVNAYLVFTNHLSTSCTLHGFPLVRYVSTKGAVLGNPSSPNGDTATTITLAHGASAHALFRESVPGVFDPTKCKPVKSSGIRVTAPSSSHAVTLHFPGTVCSGYSIHEATTSPVALGAGPVPGQCGPNQLVDSLGAPGAGLGTTYLPLVFTNPVLYTCTVRGYPAVTSVTGANHVQVGPPASDDSGASRSIWIQPFGGTASALLGIEETGNFSVSRCVPHEASALRVLAPQASHAAVLPYAHLVCTHLASTHVAVVVGGSSG